VEADIHVAVGRETAVEYMDVPEHQAEISPSLTSVETVEELPNGGKRATYTYRMAGITLDGEVAASTYDPPERIVFEMTGGRSSGPSNPRATASGWATPPTTTSRSPSSHRWPNRSSDGTTSANSMRR
jgi:carbon monoxide dehydrogenase subunit G